MWGGVGGGWRSFMRSVFDCASARRGHAETLACSFYLISRLGLNAVLTGPGIGPRRFSGPACFDCHSLCWPSVYSALNDVCAGMVAAARIAAGPGCPGAACPAATPWRAVGACATAASCCPQASCVASALLSSSTLFLCFYFCLSFCGGDPPENRRALAPRGALRGGLHELRACRRSLATLCERSWKVESGNLSIDISAVTEPGMLGRHAAKSAQDRETGFCHR